MQRIFQEDQTDVLRGAIIWIPMLEADDLDAAHQREKDFSDPRLAQYWDAHREFGRLFARSLVLKAAIAWDVYLVYPPGVAWQADLPPAPAFWMHQLDEGPARRLEPLRFEQYVRNLLERKAPE